MEIEQENVIIIISDMEKKSGIKQFDWLNFPQAAQMKASVIILFCRMTDRHSL